MKTHHKHAAPAAEPAPVSPPPSDTTETVEPPVVADPPAAEVKPELAEPPPAEILPLPIPEEVRLREKLLRLQADFDNYRKRTVREQADWSRRIREKVLLDLLPVLDSLERAEKQAREHKADDAFVGGVTLVIQQFLDILRKQGVQPIEAVGQSFDPKLHEAISQAPSDEVPEGVVLYETRKGYLVDKETLRHAQVVVSAGKAFCASAEEVPT